MDRVNGTWMTSLFMRLRDHEGITHMAGERMNNMEHVMVSTPCNNWYAGATTWQPLLVAEDSVVTCVHCMVQG